ncbi:MAG: DUF2933 domain-containing protein [Methylibium sp.]|nr:DUF2933 domain-containing protein [Methylibium sp.]
MCSMKTLIKIAFGIAAALAAGYLLLPEYRQSIATAAPYLVLLACPLMMLLMMGGGHRGTKDDEK